MSGSTGTIFNANLVEKIGVAPEENDIVDTIRGHQHRGFPS